MRSLSKIASASPLRITSTVAVGNLTPSNEKFVHFSSLILSICVGCQVGVPQVDTMQLRTLQVMSYDSYPHPMVESPFQGCAPFAPLLAVITSQES